MTETPADEDRTPETSADEAAEAPVADEAKEAPAAGEAGEAPPAATGAPTADATTQADTQQDGQAVGPPKVEPHEAGAACRGCRGDARRR